MLDSFKPQEREWRCTSCKRRQKLVDLDWKHNCGYCGAPVVWDK